MNRVLEGSLLLLAFLAVCLFATAAYALTAWVDVDLIAGHDISFREAVGIGGLLFTASGVSSRISQS